MILQIKGRSLLNNKVKRILYTLPFKSLPSVRIFFEKNLILLFIKWIKSDRKDIYIVIKNVYF